MGADRSGHCVRFVGRLDRCSGDSGHRVFQWRAGVCAGIPSRAIIGSTAQDVGRDGLCHSRRHHPEHSGTRTGQRRRELPSKRATVFLRIHVCFTQRISKLKKPHSPASRHPYKNRRSGSIPPRYRSPINATWSSWAPWPSPARPVGWWWRQVLERNWAGSPP